jgi:hypothetical protein
MVAKLNIEMDLGIIVLLLVTAVAVITLTVILVVAIAEPKPYYPNQRTSLPPAFQEFGGVGSTLARI